MRRGTEVGAELRVDVEVPAELRVDVEVAAEINLLGELREFSCPLAPPLLFGLILA